ncbi:DMT family transporter [Streptomyces sp. AcH 505]|uniref:DMT family transporter n=1 Tax=Streptomyces sp. AcH 505 TaxID=352211 RepID=UPI001F515C79
MNGAMLAAVGLSLVSAVAYATAAVAQERLAARSEPKTGLLTLLGRGAWWWSVGLNATGALLHVVALTYGSLTVVQPLGALTLVAAVPLGARRAGRQVSKGEWQGTAFTLVGLAAILLAAAGTAPSETLTLWQALGVAAVALALVGVLTRPGARPGLRHAAASGITSGVASALTQTVTVAAAVGGTTALPLWQVALVALMVAAFASGGLLLSQTAYRGGLGAPLAVLTLANPVAAAAIGLTLLGERLQGGALGIAAAAVGAVVAARGVFLLTRSSAVTGEPEPAGPAPEEPRPHPEPVMRTEPARRTEPAMHVVRMPAAGRPAMAAEPVVPLVSGVPPQPSKGRERVAAARSAMAGAIVWGAPIPVLLLPGSYASDDLPEAPDAAREAPQSPLGTADEHEERPPSPHSHCRA